jgi:hypothetical protein
MTRARGSIIDLSSTPYYHCISRCVRQAFLCGEDKFSGKNFEHRRDWIVERLSHLSKAFAIDVASYAIMHTHYHLVLRVNTAIAQQWSEANVIRRWKLLYQIPEVVIQYQKDPTAEGIAQVAHQIINEWRQRLADISWFMRTLNEYLARKANEEDQCKGRFWEGRFKSQALLDEAAVITAMAYVDLNPIRAKMAKDLPSSDYTSVQQRINQIKTKAKPVFPLMTLSNSNQQKQPNSFAFSSADYLALADWAGRAILPNKRGYIDTEKPKLIDTLNLNADGFIDLMKKTDDLSQLSVIGSVSVITHYVEKLERKFIKGMRLNQSVFN